MIEGVAYHQNVLPPACVAELWRYLSGLVFTRIERPAMHLSRSLQNDNTGNEQAAYLVRTLKAHGLSDFISFDDVSVVRYDAASDYVDWHSDGGPLLDAGCAMGVLSLGASRVMEFRRRGAEEAEISFIVAENDLVVSRAGLQAEYQHRIPPGEADGLRISVVLFTHTKRGRK